MRGTSRAVLVLLIGQLAAFGAPARAQEPAAPPAPPSPAPGTPGERPSMTLSLDDAVKRALENNADIVVEKYQPLIAEETVNVAKGYYDPFLNATLSDGSQEQKASNAFSGGTSVNTDTKVWNFGVNQFIPTGGTFNLAFTNNRQDTNSVFTTYNPLFTSVANFSLTQPLLKNLKTDTPRTAIKVSKKNREISDLEFRQVVTVVIANTKQLYYELIFAIDNLAAAQKNLFLAQKLLNENQIRVRVGTMAPLDVVSAQSEVASREEGVIVAENQLLGAEDALKQVLFARSPETWDTRIVPTDRPSAEAVPVDITGALKYAFEHRTDILAARKQIEIADLNVKFAKSQVLPQLDAFASYGGTGIGGNQLIRDTLGGPVVQVIPGSYGDALSEAWGFNYPTWRVGVQFGYSIPNRSLRAATARTRLNRDQAQAELDRLLLNAAVEVRTAGRAVETNFKRVGSTKAARVLAAQRLDAEEKKFAAGMSTNFLVTQAQRDLAVAEVNDLRAIADYRNSVIVFERVQEAGLGNILAAAATGGVTSSTLAGGNVNASSATGTTPASP